jgi:hypothetical protein
LGVLAEGGKATAKHGAEYGGDQVEIEAIEKHANADETHDASMERGNGKAVQPGAGVYSGGQIISPWQGRTGCQWSILQWRGGNFVRTNFARRR